MEGSKTVNVEVLREFCFKLLHPVIKNEEECRSVVNSMIQANLRGVDSHGVVRLLTYYKRFKTIEWQSPEVVKDNVATALIAGHNAPGQVCGEMAMKMAIEKAEQYGIGAVGVNYSNHFGTAAYYSMMAAEKGLIGFSFSNASPRIAPWGGKKPILGNNPWSFAFPTTKGFSVVSDFSNSVVAAGKIRAAAAKGEQIPLGWATDIDGVPTQDAQAALHGLLLPIGAHKGYSIIMVVDILAGILTGSGYGPQIKGIDNTDYPQNVGHFFGAIKISNFMPLDEFYQRMDEYIELIKTSPRKDNVDEIFLPGEIESNIREQRLTTGIPLSQDILEKLNTVALEVGVSGI